MNSLDNVTLDCPIINNGVTEGTQINNSNIDNAVLADPLIRGGLVTGGGMNSGLTVSHESTLTFSTVDKDGNIEYITLDGDTIKELLLIIDIVKEQNPQHFV